MNEYPEVIEVRSVRGRITEAAGGSAIARAMFEIRVDDPDGRVRGVTTGENAFRMRGVAQVGSEFLGKLCPSPEYGLYSSREYKGTSHVISEP